MGGCGDDGEVVGKLHRLVEKSDESQVDCLLDANA